jgi:N-formylglutamate deformylase
MLWSERTVGAYTYRHGNSPLVVSMPHAGTFIPPSLGTQLSDCAALRPDTDWHLARLYDFLEALDATVIRARVSRYVIDFNRPPDGSNLYPGQDTPRLCPVDTFASQPLYRGGREPGALEIRGRIERYWAPYHARLRREIERVRAAHGVAMLWDAHSIAPEVPRLFAGRLPDFNLGTAGGKSCDPGLAQRLHVALQRHGGYTSALNGRFQGGHITRTFGNPATRVHAVQLEMSTATYLEPGTPYTFSTPRAAQLRPILREQLEIVLDWATTQPQVSQSSRGL